MELLIESVLSEWRGLVQMVPRFGAALFAFILLVAVGRLVGRGVEQIVRRSDLPNTHGAFFRRVVAWLFVFFGALVSLNMLGMRSVAAGLITGGGVTAVVLGFAFREIGENFLAGFFLAFSRPFRLGDLIESGGLRGVVQGIELRYTHVRSADGRDIFIPSSQLFKDPLVNFTRDGLRRFSFTVGIDYTNDPGRATGLLLNTIRGVDGVLEEPAASVIVSGLLAAWVELEVFFWIDAFNTGRGIGAIQTDAMSAVRQTLQDNGYTLSCDTTSNIAVAPREIFEVAVSNAAPG